MALQSQEYFFPKLSGISSVLEIGVISETQESEWNTYHSNLQYKGTVDIICRPDLIYDFDVIYSREFCHIKHWKRSIDSWLRVTNKYVLLDLTLSFRKTISEDNKNLYISPNGRRIPVHVTNFSDIADHCRQSSLCRSVEIYAYNIERSAVSYCYPLSDIFKGSILIEKKTNTIMTKTTVVIHINT